MTLPIFLLMLAMAAFLVFGPRALRLAFLWASVFAGMVAVLYGCALTFYWAFT